MANDLTDPRLVGAYNFEDNLEDSSGEGSHLTHSGTPVYSATAKQGTKSLDLERDNSEYAKRLDGDLSSNFPFKSGTANKKLTACGWFRPETVAAGRVFVGKWADASGKRSWKVAVGSLNNYNFYIGYNSGNSAENSQVGYTNMVDSGAWNFFAFTLDADAKHSKLYVFAGNAWYLYEKNWTNTAYIGDGDFAIGADGAGVGCHDGLCDEVLIFNDVLSQWEIRQIMAQTYPGAKQGGLAYAAVVEVLYEEPAPGQFTYGDANVPVAVDPAAAGYSAHYAYTGNITAEVDPAAESYLYQSPNEFIYVGANIPVVVDPTADLTQKVPHYVGTVQVQVLPSGIYQNLVRVYQGSIEVEITPAATYGVPLVGWDKYYGYGLVQIDWLSEAPPFWVPTITGPTIGLDPTAAAIALHAEFTHTAEGGIVVGGEATLAITRPTTKSEVGRVGVAVGGASVLTVTRPKTISIVATGGVRLGGTPILKVSDASAIPTHSHVGWGGFLVGGNPTLTVTRPKTISITAMGGVRVMGTVQIPDVKVTRPSPFTDTKVTIANTVELEVGGDARLTVTRPGTVTIDVTPLGLVVGGDAGLVVIRPKTIEVLGDGGLILSEEPVPDQCDAWVLSGSNQEPSLYTRFLFNSYAIIQNKPHAAGNDGIYRLEGADDQGETIRSGLRVRQTNFGYDGPKRLRSVYLNEGNEQAEVRVETQFEDEDGSTVTEAGYFLKTRGGWKISRDLRGSEFIIDVANFEKLSHFEVIPFVLAKR